jgi:hypothetical protein
MKKLFLAGVLLSAVNFAQATSISAPGGMVGTSILDGTYSYLWSVPLSYNSSVTINSASITFSGIVLTATGSGNDISCDFGSFVGISGVTLAGATTTIGTAPTAGNYTTVKDNDTLGDSFAALTTGGSPKSVHLGTQAYTLNASPLTTTYTFTAAQLASLNTYISQGNWGFEIDPDCHFTVGGISFSYTTTSTNITTVPDGAMTAGLLGLSFIGLVAFRRKLCIN